MKYNKILSAVCVLILLSGLLTGQDIRTTVTRVADLLAQLPSKDNAYTDKLMSDMLALGEAGLNQICSQIIPIGSGDDTKQRFAVESLSRYLSKTGKEQEKLQWEKICIAFASDQNDYTVKDFFMKQLQLIGGEPSVEAVKAYLNDKDLCLPAVAVMGSAGGSLAEKTLSEALKDKSLPCAAAVMNTLASMKSGMAVNEFISWSSSPEKNIQAAAYNAMAQSGNPLAMPVLSKAAKLSSYKWEHSGATESLLMYARVTGDKGDAAGMDKICKTVIASCNTRDNIQYKTEALGIMVKYHGYEAMPLIFEAINHQDRSYRNAAMRLTLGLPEQAVTRKLIEYFDKAIPEARPEIIRILGERKDELAFPLVARTLFNPDINIRKEAAPALVMISGRDAIPALLQYLQQSVNTEDQEAAKSALKTVLDGKNMPQLLPVLNSAVNQGRKSAIELLSWSRDNLYFDPVLTYTSFGDEQVRSAAFRALADLSSPVNQYTLTEMLFVTENPVYVSDLQLALAAAANMIPEPEKRSSLLLGELALATQKEKLIPVLAMTGGREAVSAVLAEFEKGDPAMRKTCFNALTSWKDYSASSALYEICASGNKNYEGPAFEGYVRQVRSAPVTDEQRLLLYRKIMPYALDADRKNQIINELGRIKTWQSFIFASSYLDDPATSAETAIAVMRIALPSVDSKAGMFGTIVRDILGRAIPRFTGTESDYNKELVNKYLAAMPDEEGLVPMFNGKDLTGWQGLVEDPVARSKMKPAELVKKQAEANKRMTGNWSVKDGCIWFSGNGDNLCSIKEYADFEMYVDWKISRKGDSGIYLRGSPQVQIWDTANIEVGAQVGSGGLYNNQRYPAIPLKVADNLVGEWNTFRIVMIGERVSVWLNGILVVDNVVMENYWNRSVPIFPKGAIELQAHGNELAFRDIYVREINEKEYNLSPEEKAEGFVSLFNGRNLDNWTGDRQSYVAEEGMIVIKPVKGSGGNLFTEKEYSDFNFRFEFQLTPAANNGLGIRAPLSGDAAYAGMELQIIDDTAPEYVKLQPYQYHGSIYGVVPAKRGYQKPVGEWNYEEVTVKGTQVRVVLNGTVIVDADIAGPRDNGTMDNKEHPGLKNATGHIGFLGHGSVVRFRNIRIKDLSEK